MTTQAAKTAGTFAAHQERANAFLRRFTQGVVPHFINGEPVWSQSGATFETVDPVTSER